MQNISMAKVFKFLLTLGLWIVPMHALADELYLEAIVAPHGANAAQEMKLLITHPKWKTLPRENVFDAIERGYLTKAGQADTSQSIRLTLPNQDELLLLRTWIKKNRLSLTVERNEAARLGDNVEDSLEALEWGLKNRGDSQPVSVDDLTTVDMEGVAGEDIGLEGVPEEQKEIVVAVLDSGVDATHVDLKDHIFFKKGECEALEQYKACKAEKDANIAACDEKFAKIDSDGNGYPLDCAGWNVAGPLDKINGIRGDPDSSDEKKIGHGTFVAGIIAGVANGVGIRGIAQKVKILPVRVIERGAGSIGSQSLSEAGEDNSPPSPLEKDLKAPVSLVNIVARGMLYAIRSGAQIINLSMSWPAQVDSALMQSMVKLAHAKGIVIVAAAGNDSTEARTMPCQYEEVICAGSFGADGAMSHFSNYGSAVDVTAPGHHILSTFPMAGFSASFRKVKGYAYKNGTSFSSPMVAGIMARLLNTPINGHYLTAQEAQARLYAGTRAIGVSKLDPFRANRKFIRTGNVSLRESFSAKPRPIILSATKAPLRVAWNRKSSTLQVEIPIKNYWAAASSVELRAKIWEDWDQDHNRQSDGYRLSKDRWALGAWGANETKKIAVPIAVTDPRLTGNLQLEFEVYFNGKLDRSWIQHLDIYVPVSVELSDPEAESITYQGPPLSKNSEMRTVTSADGIYQQDYLIWEPSLEGLSLSILRQSQDSAPYQVAATSKIPRVDGTLLLVQRIDVNVDGRSDYVLVFEVRFKDPDSGKDRVKFHFQFLDDQLKPLNVEYENKVDSTLDFVQNRVQLPGRFKWLTLEKEGRKQRMPSWIKPGFVPDLDKTQADPWHPNPDDGFFARFYYLNFDGLREVKIPDEYFFLDVLEPNPDQLKQGVVPVLLGKGEEALHDFVTAEIKNAQMVNIQNYSLPQFRTLVNMANVGGVISLDDGDTTIGTYFAAEGVSRTQRVTAIFNQKDWLAQNGISLPWSVLDRKLEASSVIDSARFVTAVFAGQKRAGAFVDTTYDLQYHDLVTGDRANTTLRRYSYLAAYRFRLIYSPVVIGEKDSPGGYPALMVPSGLGATPEMDVVMPKYSADNKLLRIVRPAKLRFEANKTCDALANPFRSDADSSLKAVFFCGDRFVRIPLEY